jgi:uncharacterized protein (DUF2236 family)
MSMAVTAPIILPWPLQKSVEIAAPPLLNAGDHSSIDFLRPAGEAALVPADSVSWRVFKNPLSLFVGGVAAVVMELAEPRVRAGVWEHTTFRSDPLRRLRRTGLAAMVTVYGACSVAEAMITRVRRLHDTVAGTTLSGEPYRANDPELLNWVYATAAYGFVQAYHIYVQPLSSQERNAYYAEGGPAATLYGAIGPPTSEADLELLFEGTANRLESSSIIFEFISIVSRDLLRIAWVLKAALHCVIPLGLAFRENTTSFSFGGDPGPSCQVIRRTAGISVPQTG